MLLSEAIPTEGTQIVAALEGNVLIGRVIFTGTKSIDLDSLTHSKLAWTIYAEDGWSWAPVPESLRAGDTA